MLQDIQELYKKIGFLKVDDIFKLQQLQFYYQYLHDNLPAYLQNWKLIPNDNVHTHDTRIKNELYTFRAKHEFAKKCLRHNLPLIVNNIPDIVNGESLLQGAKRRGVVLHEKV